MSFPASGYVDAGYAIGLSTLFLYGTGLVLRRRRLERAVALREEDPGPTPVPVEDPSDWGEG